VGNGVVRSSRLECYREVQDHLFSADQKSFSRPIGNGGGSGCGLGQTPLLPWAARQKSNLVSGGATISSIPRPSPHSHSAEQAPRNDCSYAPILHTLLYYNCVPPVFTQCFNACKCTTLKEPEYICTSIPACQSKFTILYILQAPPLFDI
jgi:hypothetical protein